LHPPSYAPVAAAAAAAGSAPSSSSSLFAALPLASALKPPSGGRQWYGRYLLSPLLYDSGQSHAAQARTSVTPMMPSYSAFRSGHAVATPEDALKMETAAAAAAAATDSTYSSSSSIPPIALHHPYDVPHVLSVIPEFQSPGGQVFLEFALTWDKTKSKRPILVVLTLGIAERGGHQARLWGSDVLALPAAKRKRAEYVELERMENGPFHAASLSLLYAAGLGLDPTDLTACRSGLIPHMPNSLHCVACGGAEWPSFFCAGHRRVDSESSRAPSSGTSSGGGGGAWLPCSFALCRFHGQMYASRLADPATGRVLRTDQDNKFCIFGHHLHQHIQGQATLRMPLRTFAVRPTLYIMFCALESVCSGRRLRVNHAAGGPGGRGVASQWRGTLREHSLGWFLLLYPFSLPCFPSLIRRSCGRRPIALSSLPASPLPALASTSFAFG
jgi:hypothetical protein